MAYDVTFSKLAARELASIPPEAWAGLAAALDSIAADPGQGDRHGQQYPPDMRTAVFGDWGLIVYLIRPRARQIAVLDFTWAK